jgi:predicted CXXCH cytochrome family protein
MTDYSLKRAIEADQLPAPVEFEATCQDCGAQHTSTSSSARIAASGRALCMDCLWKAVEA